METLLKYQLCTHFTVKLLVESINSLRTGSWRALSEFFGFVLIGSPVHRLLNNRLENNATKTDKSKHWTENCCGIVQL